MFDRFTDRCRKVMALANQEAQRFNHEYVGTEHILLGLVKEGTGVGAHVLKNLDVDLRKVRLEVEKIIKPGPEMVTMGKLPQTPRTKKVIEYAVQAARDLNHNYVGTEHLLLGLLQEHDGVGAHVLRQCGINIEETREEVLNLLGATTDAAPAELQRDAPGPILRRLPGCALCESIKKARELPTFVVELEELFVFLSENQGSSGWCVCVLRNHAEHVADLTSAHQVMIWLDIARVAAGIRKAFPDTGKDGGPPRINYECLGNLVPHIHWHIIPRHADDPDPTKTVWIWTPEQLKGNMTDAERAELIARLRNAIE